MSDPAARSGRGTERHELQVLRASVLPTLAVAVVVVAVAGAVEGAKGALGAALGTFTVVAFFTAGVVVLGRASRINPFALMNVAIATYVVKIGALAGVLVALQDTEAFHRPSFGIALLVATLVWVTAEVRAFSRLKILYVEPGTAVPGMPAPSPGGAGGDASRPEDRP